VTVVNVVNVAAVSRSGGIGRKIPDAAKGSGRCFVSISGKILGTALSEPQSLFSRGGIRLRLVGSDSVAEFLGERRVILARGNLQGPSRGLRRL